VDPTGQARDLLLSPTSWKSHLNTKVCPPCLPRTSRTTKIHALSAARGSKESATISLDANRGTGGTILPTSPTRPRERNRRCRARSVKSVSASFHAWIHTCATALLVGSPPSRRLPRQHQWQTSRQITTTLPAIAIRPRLPRLPHPPLCHVQLPDHKPQPTPSWARNQALKGPHTQGYLTPKPASSLHTNNRSPSTSPHNYPQLSSQEPHRSGMKPTVTCQLL